MKTKKVPHGRQHMYANSLNSKTSIGSALVLDKSATWATTPYTLGDYIREQTKYTNFKGLWTCKRLRAKYKKFRINRFNVV